MRLIKHYWQPALLVIIGIGILLKPQMVDVYNKWQQEQLISMLVESTTLLEESPSTGVSLEASDENNIKSNVGHQENDLTKMPLVGKIEIESIELKMPIIAGATATHLNLTACSVVPDRKIGAVNNYVLAGHRGRSYGKHFNRLDEVLKGDEIHITDKSGERFVYIVKSNFVVAQSNLKVLDNQEGIELTLITCEPSVLKNSDKRRIVQAVLK